MEGRNRVSSLLTKMEKKPVRILLHSVFSQRKLIGFLFVLPGLTFFLIFFFYPVLNAIVISFTRWDLFSPKQFVGLGNFIELFKDPDFGQALKVSCLFALGVCLSLWFVSLFLALLINNELHTFDFISHGCSDHLGLYVP